MSLHEYNTSSGWDTTAERYAARLEEVTGKAGGLLIDMSNELLPFSPSSNVLDVGAGSGVLTYCLSERYPNLPILATDLSRRMLDLIDKKNLSNVNTKVVDINNISGSGLEPGSFSHVLSTMMIQFVDDQQQALRKMSQPLYKGGVIGIGRWGTVETAEPWIEACKKIRPEFELDGDFFGKAAWKTCEELEHGLKAAGFKNVKSESRKFEIDYGDADGFLTHF